MQGSTASGSRPKSALVIGAGSIGRRHLANLQALGILELSACDPNPARLEYVKAQFQAASFMDVERALEERRPDMVLVCTPPVHHVVQSIQAIQAGAHVFVEKPVSDRLEGLEELLDEQRKQGRAVQVGYNLRFHPPLRKLKELVDAGTVGKIQWGRIEAGSYLPEWRPWQDYRQSYTARRELGGGIILDGSHELDYATWLFGSPTELACMAGKTSSLEVDVEDCATILLRFPGSLQIDVHVDFMQRFYSRGCVLAGEFGTLHWDFKSNMVHIRRPDEETEILNFECDVNHMYVEELRHFIECIQNGKNPTFSFQDAILTLRLALAARTSAQERRWLNFES